MQPYFELTGFDREFHDRHLRDRLPPRILDIHVHLNLPEHIRGVPEERWRSDWALEAGHLLPLEDALACARQLYPGCEYGVAGFPWPIREADLAANNRWLARLRAEGRARPFMAVRPEWDPEEVERTLLEGGFAGFKPYADMLTGVKGAEVGIFEFFPPAQWEILDRHRRAVVLHLPRRERFADDDNVRELLEARQRYPGVTIVIAHFGRSFCPWYLREGLRKTRGAEGFHFDTSAVINPEVYDLAFASLPAERILYGSDMPILFWHGRREWTERTYRNLCREPFSWNTRREPPEVEAGYTLFLYEQMRAILDALERAGLGAREKELVFGGNAERVLAPPPAAG